MNTLQMGIPQFKERDLFDQRIRSRSSLCALLLGLIFTSNAVQAAPLLLKEHRGLPENLCSPYSGSDAALMNPALLVVNVVEGFSPGLYSVFWETGDGPSVAINVTPDGNHSKSGGPNTINASQVKQFVIDHGRPPNLISRSAGPVSSRIDVPAGRYVKLGDGLRLCHAHDGLWSNDR